MKAAGVRPGRGVPDRSGEPVPEEAAPPRVYTGTEQRAHDRDLALYAYARCLRRHRKRRHVYSLLALLRRLR